MCETSTPEIQTTDQPTASCSHSAENEQIEPQFEGSPTVSTQPGKTPRVCIFCDIAVKRAGGKRFQTITSNCPETLKRLKESAERLEDTRLVNKLIGCNVLNYHKICKLNFYKSCEKSVQDDQDAGIWHGTRQIHNTAFEVFSIFIQEEIVKKEKVFYLQDLNIKYKNLLLEISDGKYNSDFFSNYKVDHLQTKIMQHFGDVLTIEPSGGHRNKKIVYNREMDVTKLLNESAFDENAEQNKQESVAYAIRNAVKMIERNPLPDKVQVEDLLNGECQIPEMLFAFISNLIQGPDYRRKNSSENDIKIKSLCQDIIYAITKGRVKPAKHLMLGLTMKSLTSSRKVLTILNKYGHSISYSAAEELETELTYTAYSNNDLIPPGIDIKDIK